MMEGYLELHFSDGSRLIVDDRFTSAFGEQALRYGDRANAILEEHSAASRALPYHPV
jgi:hypothetical protein